SLNDHAAGLCSVVAVLSALEARRRTGEGQHIDIAQLETGAYVIGPAVLDYLSNGHEIHPNGNVDPFGQWCPNEVYRCGDEHAVFGERPYDRFPGLWSGTDLEPYMLSGAYIGEHNFEVYTELAGMSEEEIAAAMADGLFN